MWHFLRTVSDCFCQQEQLCLFTRKEKKGGEWKEASAEGESGKTESFIAC